MKGKIIEREEDMILEDGTKIIFLKPGETYKFMGIHQSSKTDLDILESKAGFPLKLSIRNFSVRRNS